MIDGLGRWLIGAGLFLVALGALFLLVGRLPGGSWGWLTGWFGRLPGDILVRRGPVTFYFPIVTSVVLSLLVSLIWWVITRR